MPLVTRTYENVDDPTLEEYLSYLRSIINSLDNANLAAAAGIEASKVQNGSLITSHASRHASSGLDPLPNESISGAMIQKRVINSSHIGIGAILPEHMGTDDSIAGNVYTDGVLLTASHGDTITAPDGYTVWWPQLMHVSIPAYGNEDQTIALTGIGFTKSGENWVAQCEMQVEVNGTPTSQKGTLSYIRVGFK